MYVCLYISIYVYMYACMHACMHMYVCMHVNMYMRSVSMYVYMCVYVFACVCFNDYRVAKMHRMPKDRVGYFSNERRFSVESSLQRISSNFFLGGNEPVGR